MNDCEFKVQIEDSVSCSKVKKTGVSQGSILGPILFSIYTIELHYILQNLSVFFHCYTDDTQIYLKFSIIEEAEATVNNVYTSINPLRPIDCVMNSLGSTVFTPRASEVGNIQPFCRKNRFVVNFRGS